MKTSSILLGLPALGLAFPAAMMGDLKVPREAMLDQLKTEEASFEDLEKRQGLLDTLTGTVGGLLGSVAQAINPDNKRPEPGFEFRAPGPGDSRGPCPGLNLLANHGYLPRNGRVNSGQVLEAVARGFNMGTDLATVLVVFAMLTDGDPVTTEWNLGAGPNNVGGLNRHSTVEADISPNREDYYFGCGDNHHLSSRMFKQNVAFAEADPNKEFTIDVMAKQFEANGKFSRQNNPFLYYFPFPSIVSVVAFNFYPAFFSNGTYGQGGVANYESISSIIGAELQDNGDYKYVPERYPENWYRRDYPYGAVQALTEGFTQVYPKNPIPMPIAQLGTDNLTPQTILCNVYQGLNSITPLALAAQDKSLLSSISWSLGKLVDVGISDTILGCPASVLSPDFLLTNTDAEGGPLNPPPSIVANTGDNVYNKVYFPQTPDVNPVCQ